MRTQGVYVHKVKAMWGYNQKMAMCKPKRELSGETKPENTLILDF